jgi:hypothetical protein
MTDEESGMDELMRLQQQFSRQQEEHDDRKKQQEEQGKKAQGVLRGLKDLQFDMTIQQLQSVATPDIIAELDALKNKPDTEYLRRLISGMADDIENRLEAIANSDSETKPLVDSMRVLNILMDLYFSLK